MRGMNEARAQMEAQLIQYGKTLADVLEWDFNLAEDDVSVVITASIEGHSFVAGFDWPKGYPFSPWDVSAEFLNDTETATRH